MTEPDLPQINAELAELLRSQLGIRGTGLAVKLRRAGRLLPRRVRQAGAELVEMEALWQNPKLRRRIDPAAVAAAAATVRKHLEGIDVADRRKGYWLGVVTPLAFNLLVLFALALILWPILQP